MSINLNAGSAKRPEAQPKGESRRRLLRKAPRRSRSGPSFFKEGGIHRPVSCSVDHCHIFGDEPRSESVTAPISLIDSRVYNVV